MAAIDTLELSIARLSASVDNAVRVLGIPGPVPGDLEARIQAASDGVNSQSDKLDAATAGR